MIFVIHICISVLIIPDTEKYSTAMCYIIIIIIIVVNAHNYYPQSTLSSHRSFLDCSVRENSDIFIFHHQQLFSFALTLAHNNNSSASSVDIIIMIIIILDGHYLRIVAFSIVSAWEFSSELLTFPFFTINNFHLPCLPCVKLPPRKFSTIFAPPSPNAVRCQMDVAPWRKSIEKINDPTCGSHDTSAALTKGVAPFLHLRLTSSSSSLHRLTSLESSHSKSH